MSEEELLDAMCQAYWKAGPGIRNPMRSILELLHAHGYRRCADGQKVTQYCSAWEQADKACRDLTEKVLPNIRARAEKAEAEVERLQSAASSAAAAVTRFSAEADALRAEVNEFRRVLRSVVRYDVGYEWDGTKMCHTPLLKIEFSDVPAGEPNTAVGWLDRDAFSASIDAARGES